MKRKKCKKRIPRKMSFGKKIFNEVKSCCTMLNILKIASFIGMIAFLAKDASLEYALIMISSIYIHELGHYWTAVKYGVPTKGIIFIPGVGGGAIITGESYSRKTDFLIAIMGPLFGLVFAVISAIIYLFTKNIEFAVIAYLVASMNLFNLLPILPLDGGRACFALGFSLNKTWGTIICLLSVSLGLILLKINKMLSSKEKLIYLGVITVFNVLWVIIEQFYDDRKFYISIKPRKILSYFGTYASVAILLIIVAFSTSSIPGVKTELTVIMTSIM